jgi:alanine dehydrogenase
MRHTWLSLAALFVLTAAPALAQRTTATIRGTVSDQTGAVIVDVSIDQGGCVETARPTTHQQPTYLVDGVVHYCVTNMPGAVGRTSTFALCNVTLPWVMQLARLGIEPAIRQSLPLASAANICRGRVTNQAVAETFGLKYKPISAL